jgi:hypothetical protein
VTSFGALELAIPPEVRASRATTVPVAVMRLGQRIGILKTRTLDKIEGVVAMEDLIDSESARESEESRVYAWRVEQLAKLGLSTAIADAVANVVDWHEVARLVQKGCPPELALEIAR